MEIERVEDLHVYAVAYAAAMESFEHSRAWPREERYALTDQVRRSSRSVSVNLSEAWAKRRYPAHFVSKLSDAHGEAEETLTWLRFARDCGYVEQEAALALRSRYHQVIGGLIKMMATPEPWCLPSRVGRP